jgi:hypothetical protein
MKKTKILILSCCFLLQACADKFYEQRPFDVSLPDQVFRSSFIIKKEYDYRFSLIFNWKNPENYQSQEEQKLATGGFDVKGLPLALNLTIVKDNEIFLDETIQTQLVSRYEGFCYNKKSEKNHPRQTFMESIFSNIDKCSKKIDSKSIWGPSRTIDIRTLPPGNYRVEIKTLSPAPAFSGMEAFISISPYAPKI